MYGYGFFKKLILFSCPLFFTLRPNISPHDMNWIIISWLSILARIWCVASLSYTWWFYSRWLEIDVEMRAVYLHSTRNNLTKSWMEFFLNFFYVLFLHNERFEKVNSEFWNLIPLLKEEPLLLPSFFFNKQKIV